jgi:hypothetical protein
MRNVTIGRWILATLAAAGAAAFVGVVVVSFALFDAWANMSDFVWLLVVAGGVGLSAAVILFVPLTLVGSAFRGPARMIFPPAALTLIGMASYINRYGPHPPRGDRPLEVLLVWSSLLVGQVLHSVLLLRRSRRTVAAS